jgi:hypothetical protein
LNRKCGYSPTENSCEWRTDTSPPYRNTVCKFALLLTGENEFGKNEQLFVINHYSIIKPNIPRNLEVNHMNVTPNSIAISWSAPEYIECDEEVFESITLIYEIRYFRIDSQNSDNSNDQPIIIGGIRDNSLVLKDLLPYNRYNVSIRCKTIQSQSDEYWSEFSSIIATTKPDGICFVRFSVK